ncbi:DUF3649 domain-containing protein [Massilia rhizosphaerae]|uniref:DUF3649 domain-containing protein n=1 Tax=Massilia rhizosphaerae TaxID=2784389 RepID=UPI003F8B1CC1
MAVWPSSSADLTAASTAPVSRLTSCVRSATRAWASILLPISSTLLQLMCGISIQGLDCRACTAPGPNKRWIRRATPMSTIPCSMSHSIRLISASASFHACMAATARRAPRRGRLPPSTSAITGRYVSFLSVRGKSAPNRSHKRLARSSPMPGTCWARKRRTPSPLGSFLYATSAWNCLPHLADEVKCPATCQVSPAIGPDGDQGAALMALPGTSTLKERPFPPSTAKIVPKSLCETMVPTSTSMDWRVWPSALGWASKGTTSPTAAISAPPSSASASRFLRSCAAAP